MSRAIAFLAGLGQGYLNAEDAKAKREREDEDRALANEERRLRMEAQQRELKDKQALRDAVADRTVNPEAASLEMADGRSSVYDMPDGQAIANSDFRQLRAADARSGQPALAMQPLSVAGLGGEPDSAVPVPKAPVQVPAVEGRSFASLGGAQAAADAANTPQAKQGRVVAAMMGMDPAKAMQLQQGAQQLKLGGHQVAESERAEARARFNEALMGAIKSPDPWVATAQLLSDTNIGVLNGATVEPRPSEDGKTIRFVALKGGKEQPLFGQFENSPEGLLKLYATGSMVDPKTQLEWWREQQKSQQDQSNKDRDFSLRRADSELQREKFEADKPGRAAEVGLREAQTEYYRANAGKAHAQDPAIRMDEADKIRLQSIERQSMVVEKSIADAQAMGGFDPKDPGAQALITQKNNLVAQREKILGRYQRSGGDAERPFGAIGTQKPSEPTPSQLEAIRADAQANGIKDPVWAPTGQAISMPGAQPASPTSPKPVQPPQAAAGQTPQAITQQPVATRVSVASALNPSGNAGVAEATRGSSAAIEQAVGVVKAAQAQLAAAAKSGDPAAVTAYAQRLQQARDQFGALLSQMNPQQADALRKAAGVY